MQQLPVLIAGGGIGGLALALTLNQIGVPFKVIETVNTVRPLGVGINLQPNAVRELYDLGITARELDSLGLPIREWALVGRNGIDIHAEPRGRDAGYRWPQYALHRGRFHMLLHDHLIRRAGTDALQLGSRVTGYRNNPDGTVTAEITDARGYTTHLRGALLIGADGIHSNVRAQMHPDQPPIHWGGAVMWRGTTRARPLRTGASFVGLGGSKQRMIIYPITAADSDGFATINWIAEVAFENAGDRPAGWFKPADLPDFAHHFDDWSFDWLDVPALLQAADVIYENPMIDRDPVATWRDGAVALIGDAAHAMYPTGSNGASQAIIDARTLGATMLARGVTPDALGAYDAALCGPVSELVLRNRGAGPFGLLDIVEDRCDGVFDTIDDIVSPSERTAFMARYKAAAGFAMDTLNNADPMIAADARIGA